MAADTDLKTEALVRQLHRELNGLTRTSRRTNPSYSLSLDSIGAVKQQQQQRDKDFRSEGAGTAGGVTKRPRTEKDRERIRERERDRDCGRGASGTGSHRRRTSPPRDARKRQRRVRGIDDSENAGSDEEEEQEGEAGTSGNSEEKEQEYDSTRSSSGSEDSQSESDAQAHKRHKGGSRDERGGSRVYREAAGRQRARDKERQRERDRQREKEQRHERERQRQREEERDEQEVGPIATCAHPLPRSAVAPTRTEPAAGSTQQPSVQDTREPDRARSHAAAVPGREPHAAVGRPASLMEPEVARPAAQVLHQQQQLQLQQQIAEQQLTPLEAAAAAASGAVKEQAKASGQIADPRLVKCFHAGVRWGIKLSRQALQTRSDLATALNDAFAGEILSCGRGETLYIVFLDAQGRAMEFPSLRIPNGRGKDSATKWRAMVERAVKIYVRRA